MPYRSDMRRHSLKFGTSGLRGLSSELEGAAARRFVYAFAQVMHDKGYMAPGGTVLLGRDLRQSSPAINSDCIAGLETAGFLPVDCGALPTPALARHALVLGVPAIMVTGSHIPGDRNGLKFYRPDGEIDKQDEAAILAAEIEAPDEIASPGGLPRSDSNAASFYVDRALGILEPDALRGMKVGVYQHSSVMRDMLVEVLAKLGAEVVPFGRSDIFVSVDTEALRQEDADACCRAAGEHGLNAVVSTDGDGDRPLIADEKGDFLRGDLLGAITADMLGADCLVTPITSNTGIERSGRFVKVVRTRIGSPHVIAGMKQAVEQGAATVVGFEANGGVLLGTDARIAGHVIPALPTRDAMLPILAILWAWKRSQRPLSAFAGAFGFGAALAARLKDVPEERSGPFLATLRDDKAFRDGFADGLLRVGEVDTTDGVRMAADDGSVLHYRASGNAPELRCYVEAGSAEKALHMLEEGLARARRHLEAG
jgi:phosphomannomutase